MKAFNGRAAADEYMSTHSLAFSTPEMTLKKFALWLGEQVTPPEGKGQIPRLLVYVEEKGSRRDSEFAPDTDDSFRPSGAVTDMYGSDNNQKAAGSATDRLPRLTPLGSGTLESGQRFCIECGSKLKAKAKFCTKCGSEQS